MKIVKKVPESMGGRNGGSLNWEALIKKCVKGSWLQITLEEYRYITGSRSENIKSVVIYKSHPHSTFPEQLNVKTRALPTGEQYLYFNADGGMD